MKNSSVTVPIGVQKKWGSGAVPAILKAVSALSQRGFSAPLTWRHGYFVPFMIDPGETVRVTLSISAYGGVDGYAGFDSTMVLLSKTIFEKTQKTDPWFPVRLGDAPWQNGYVACLASKLSHAKWASAPSQVNPAWVMCVDNGHLDCDVDVWINDFDRWHLPFIRGLTSDEMLGEALDAAIEYVRPSWVKSSAPGFVNIRELLLALRR